MVAVYFSERSLQGAGDSMAQRSRQGLMTGVLLAAVAALLLPGVVLAGWEPSSAFMPWLTQSPTANRFLSPQ